MAHLTLSYLCSSCGKEYGPLTTKPIGKYIEIPVNCMMCKTMYTTNAEIKNNDLGNIVLIDKKCKKCKSELELFTGKCASCGAIAVSAKL